MCFFNVTDHVVCLERACGERISVAPSGPIARVNDRRRVVGEADEIPIREILEQEIVGLPAPAEGRIYIASLMVARVAAAQGRTDVVAPDTSLEGSVRGGKSHKLRAVRGFQRFPAVAA